MTKLSTEEKEAVGCLGWGCVLVIAGLVVGVIALALLGKLFLAVVR